MQSSLRKVNLRDRLIKRESNNTAHLPSAVLVWRMNAPFRRTRLFSIAKS